MAIALLQDLTLKIHLTYLQQIHGILEAGLLTNCNLKLKSDLS